jgi:hypothetical protein
MTFQENMHGVLARLPCHIEWLVAFDIASMRAVADEPFLRAAYFIPDSVPLVPEGAIVLTSAGRGLLSANAVTPYWTDATPWPCLRLGATSLLAAYGERLSLLAPDDDVFCIGLGQTSAMPPVAMTVSGRGGGEAVARAALDTAPETAGYELLAGCGVSFVGARAVGNHHVATFRNRLSAHFTAALGSAFARTAHCNLFFLRGARLDDGLTTGLIHAGAARIAVAGALVEAQAIALAISARQSTPRMTALSPCPSAPLPMGDLVPLGLLLRALRHCGGGTRAVAAATLIERHLDARRQDGLWSFESDRLVTATDSALVLLGRGDPVSIAALERFGDGAGGYVPQLIAAEPTPGHMLEEPETAHWAAADLPTTCLVRQLRHEAGLSVKTPLALLRHRFATRSGLFFANPFLVDWCFALAIADDPDAETLRGQLAAEIAAAADADFSFGIWDRGLSTACAILALAACGRRGRLMRCAQLRLIDLVDDTGQPAASAPFYSSLRIAPTVRPNRLVADRPGVLRVGGQCHALTLYEDTGRIVGTALRALALAQSADPTDIDLPNRAAPAPCHPRYRAPSVSAYIRDFALPPYLAHTPAVAVAA